MDGQLALQLPSELPSLKIEPEWKDQQRLWGHSFHPMCSYLASFPASLAHAFIARYTRPGDVVLDPFSGRGTTPLQACAEGRVGAGNDLNPFAQILTAAIRLYVAKSDGEERTFRPIGREVTEPLTATELLSAVSELLRALRLGPMELALWYRRRPDEP